MKTSRPNTALLASVAIGALTAGGLIGSMATLMSTRWLVDGASTAILLPIVAMTTAVAGCAVLGFDLFRRRNIHRLEKEASKRQALELEQQRSAMNTHSIVTVSNPAGIMTSVNQKFCDVWGYSKEDVIGQPVTMLYPQGQTNADFKEIHACLKAGKMWSGETVLVDSQNNQLVMLGTTVPMYDDQGVHIQNITVRTDITTLRKTEKAQFLKPLLDNLTDEVYIYEVDSLALQYMNIRAVERCGWLGQDVTEKRITDSDPNFDETNFRHHVAPLVSGDADTVTIETVQQKGPVEIKTRLYQGNDGQRLFISVLRDTTERAELEKARLESVSVISHELRTPLTSIKGALRLLQSGALGELSDKAKPVLDIADRNSDRLLLVVNDILDLEKIRAGKVEFDLKRKDLVTFLQDAVEMNKGYADEYGVGITLDIDLNEAWANIETDRLMQVMSNLISNAAKYSPKGDKLVVRLRQESKYLRIEVQDNGPGIPESDRGSVFESFKQLDSPDGIQRMGTGLGLAISKSIVKSHGGRIDYSSKVGKGSTFFVELPSLDNRGNVIPILAGRAAVA